MKILDLSEESFFRLLARLNTDPVLAGEEYEKLRARLMYFFERKGCRIPAELTDETINRIARKMEEGLEIEDLFRFSLRRGAPCADGALERPQKRLGSARSAGCLRRGQIGNLTNVACSAWKSV